LARLERRNLFRVGGEELPMFAQGEEPFLHPDRITAMGECGSGFEQFLARNRERSGSYRRTAAARVAFFETIRRAPTVPHLESPSDELVAAGPFHAIDAKICSPDADRVSPVSMFRAGLYFVVTRRCRGSSGVATGAPR